MNPQQPDNPNSNEPVFNSPFTPPSAQQPAPVVQNPTPPLPPVGSKNKLPLIVLSIVGVCMLLIVVFIIVANATSKKDAKKPTSSTSTQQSQGLQPATAITTQQASDSISQDISSVSNDQDFPANKLDDKALGL